MTAQARECAISVETTLAKIRSLVLARPDLTALLAEQARMLPRRVFGSRDLSAEQFLDIYFEEHRFLFDLVRPRLRPGIRILEVGGGLGFFHVLAHGAGADIVSLEPSQSGFSVFRAFALPVVRELTGEPERFIDTRVEDLDWPDAAFDLVVSNNVLEHVDDVPRVMRAMYRLAAPGGQLLHHCPNYLFPYEPHYKIPVLPCGVRLSGRICWRAFAQDELWRSLNGISSLQVMKLARELPGARLRFLSGFKLTLDRMAANPYLAARHGRLTRFVLHPFVRGIIERLPGSLNSPMVFEISKRGAPPTP